jgi:POT family proton-dependent oligopeptide transporter
MHVTDGEDSTIAISDMQHRNWCGRQRQLFGHPRGLTFLFATEMWERFSYYGMRALLVIYMVRYLLLPERADSVIGLAPLRSLFESIFGPLGVQPFASHLYGFYTGFVYLTPIFGGLIADRLLGQRRTVILGASLMALGHFMMAFEPLFLFAILTIILGSGCFKPNISSQVGSLYAQGDSRRDRAYSIFYVGINLGAMLAPLVAGTLGEEIGWHYGFGAAGIGMMIGLAVYIYASPLLPPDALRCAPRDKIRLDASERSVVVALLFLLMPTSLFWATYEQQGNTIALWASDFTDRSINLIFWRGEIPVTWFQAFNPFMILAFTPLVLGLWSWQARRSQEPSTLSKMAFGCFACAVSYLIMAVAAWQSGGDKANWLWLLAYFVIITMGELYLSPIGLSLVSKLSPARTVSAMMGLWLSTNFVGNFLAGWLGSFWSTMDKMSFFLMIAALASITGIVFLIFRKPLRTMLNVEAF